MLYILSIANTTPDAIAPALEAAGVAATIVDSLGVAAPWPPERGVTCLIATNVEDVPHYGTGATVREFARQWCADHGETCAALTIVPASFTLLYASEA